MISFRVLLLLCAILISDHIRSQTYQDVTESQNIDVFNSNATYGNGISFSDFNNDGWDDLSFASIGGNPKFYLNNSGIYTQFNIDLNINLNNDIKAIIWVDYDNDGDKDLFLSYNLEPVKLYNNNGSFNMTEVTESTGLLQESVPHYGASWGDYNNDGCLDIFICKYSYGSNGYSHKNHLYKNNCDGTFSDVSDEAGMTTNEYPSFQSVFFDYDKDGWQDLYVINDRIIYNNTLYHNNGDGTFTNIVNSSGTDIAINAMTNTCGDYDNDGDLDIYITNTQQGNVLLQNNGDLSFTDVSEEAQIEINLIGWGALWIDYDNDTFQDLYVATEGTNDIANQNYLLQNNGSGLFVNALNKTNLQDIDVAITFAVAMGDINNDGYPDYAQNNRDPFECRLFENSGGSNHYLKVSVEGSVSNKDGIGTWIEVWVAGQKYVRYTYCGENYLGQNSPREFFGLETADTVDSLNVVWLSGQEDTFYNIAADQTLHIVEGSSLQNEISYSGSLNICANDSILLDGGSFSSYLWSTGDTTSYIYVNQNDVYSVIVYNETNIPIESSGVEVVILENPDISISTSGIQCYGDSSTSAWVTNMSDTGIDTILWDLNSGTDSINNLLAGIHSCILTDMNGCQSSLEFEILETDEITSEIEVTNVLCYGDSNGFASVTPFGGIGELELNWNGLDNENLSAGDYSVELIDSLNCSQSFDFQVTDPDSLSIELTIFPQWSENLAAAEVFIDGGTEPYNTLWSTAQEGIFVYELLPGDYSVEITDFNLCEKTEEFSIVNNDIPELLKLEIKLFPNPASDYVTIEHPSAIEISSIGIYEPSGKMIFRQQLELSNDKVESNQICLVKMNDKELLLSFKSLSKGEYFIELISDDFKHCLPLIIE